MLMKNRKLYQMLAVTAGVLLLSGCGASSAQETGITSSDPQEPTTISEETKAPDSTESTENTKSTESKASESESSAETAAETESQLQQSEIQQQKTDQQISRINYYDADGKLIYYDSYAYYDNGLLCSTTLHSVDYYDNGNGEQDSYTGNEYTFLYLYDADGNIKTTMPGSLTIADNYNDETGNLCWIMIMMRMEIQHRLSFIPKKKVLSRRSFMWIRQRQKGSTGLHRFFRRGQKMDGLLPI